MKAAGFNGIDFAIHEQTSLLVNLVSSCPVPPIESQIVNLLVQENTPNGSLMSQSDSPRTDIESTYVPWTNHL